MHDYIGAIHQLIGTVSTTMDYLMAYEGPSSARNDLFCLLENAIGEAEDRLMDEPNFNVIEMNRYKRIYDNLMLTLGCWQCYADEVMEETITQVSSEVISKLLFCIRIYVSMETSLQETEASRAWLYRWIKSTYPPRFETYSENGRLKFYDKPHEVIQMEDVNRKDANKEKPASMSETVDLESLTEKELRKRLIYKTAIMNVNTFDPSELDPYLDALEKLNPLGPGDTEKGKKRLKEKLKQMGVPESDFLKFD